MENKENKPLVIYHQNCPDGMCGALVAWNKYNGNIDLVSAKYGDMIHPDLIKNRDVFIIDFSFPREILKEMAPISKSFIILDHHASAQKQLDGLQEEINSQNVLIKFDMNKSGAMLAWEYFNPKIDAPLLVKYVEDYDLWKFNLPSSREVNAAIASYPFDINIYNKLLSTTFNDLYDAGSAILRYQNKAIEEMLQDVRMVAFGKNGEYTVPCCNCSVKSLTSSLGNKMAPGYPFAVIYSITKDGSHYYSLRSITGDKNLIGLDVSEVASSLGGGGHKNSSGLYSKYPLHASLS